MCGKREIVSSGGGDQEAVARITITVVPGNGSSFESNLPRDWKALKIVTPLHPLKPCLRGKSTQIWSTRGSFPVECDTDLPYGDL